MPPHPDIKVIFFGTPDFSVPTLTSLLSTKSVKVLAVVTQPDRPAGRGQQPMSSPIKQLALQHRLPILQPENIRADTNSFLKSLEPLGSIDLNVVIAFGQILPIKVLNFPRSGSVNIHASLLPRWRGAAPIQRAIMAGDSETGVCLMQMEKGLDTGPVFASARVPIEADDDFGTLHDKLSKLGAELLTQNIAAIAAGILSPTPQPDSGVTYAKKVENSESEIIWLKPATELSNLIRGLSPMPGAYTLIEDKRLKILGARVTGPWIDSNQPPSPGTIVRLENDLLEVQCGDGVLALEHVQLEGKKRIGIGEFLKGFKLRKGDRLGRIATS